MKDVYPPPWGMYTSVSSRQWSPGLPFFCQLAYPWDKYSFEKGIHANKVGIERGYSFEKYTFKKK